MAQSVRASRKRALHEVDVGPPDDRHNDPMDEATDDEVIDVPGYRSITNVHFGVYFVGERPLMSFETDMMYGFAKQHIYLIRGVDMQGLQVPGECRAEALAMAMISNGQATWDQIQRLVDTLPSDANLRWNQNEQGKPRDEQSTPCKFTTGAWIHGPMSGLHNHTNRFPWTTRAMTSIIRTWDSSLKFSTCSLIRNVMASPHKDSHNHAQSVNLSLPCSDFHGGQLFVADAQGRSQLQPEGVRGHVVSMNEATRFPPRATHASLPWAGNRHILLAYHIRTPSRLSELDRSALCRAGFCIGFIDAEDDAA